MIIKTRFAPSPTGCFHIGSVRTALYAWLFARHNKGIFVLRLEDTDYERSTKSSVKKILDGLQWLGLTWDEGPYFQSKRLAYYQELAYKMLTSGNAYKCYCSKDRLDKLRKDQILKGLKPRYDRKCRNLKSNCKANSVYVIRFRNPRIGQVVFHDQIRGKIVFDNQELDDLIILRSNKIPTYNFCVVIDDKDMEITHVIRGEDHINNTPRQINILYALGAKIPKYAHLSMIVDNFGKKLSKRNNIVDIMEYYKMGYLPEAMLNYIVRLGWSHGNQEIFSLEEMKKYFTLQKTNKSSSLFDTKKLLWLNHHYINTLPVKYISQCLKYFFRKANIDIKNGPVLTDIVNILGHRCKTLQEIVQLSRYFYEDFNYSDNVIIKEHLNISHLVLLRKMINKISLLSVWSIENLSLVIKQLTHELDVSLKEIGMPIRVTIIGSTISPSIAITMYFIGKNRLLNRIKKSIEYIIESSSISCQ